MKKYTIFFSFFSLACLLWQCSKDESVAPAPVNSPTSPVTTHTITSFLPIAAEQGAEVTVTGTNFPTERTQIEVRVGNASTMVNPFTATATQIKFLVPYQATTGKISIKIGATIVNSTNDFTVNATPAPNITNISAASVLTKRGIVLIEGTNLYRTAPNAPQPKYYMKDANGQDVEMKIAGSTNAGIPLFIPENAVNSPIKAVTFAGQASSASQTLKTITYTNFAALAGASGSIQALAVGANGTLYGIDRNAVVKFPSNGGTPTVIAGVAGTSGAINGTGTAARFNNPKGLAIDASNNLYVADTDNHAIRKVTPAGVVTTFAGSLGTAGFVSGALGTARFNKPFGLTMTSGNAAILITDNGNKAIRGINFAQSNVYDVYGAAATTNNELGNPQGISTSAANDIYIADADKHVVWKLINNNSLQAEFGTPNTAGFADGWGSNKFNKPAGLLRLEVAMFITDSQNHSLRWGRMSQTSVFTAVGAPPNADGQPTANQPFTIPTAIAGINNNGVYTIYVASLVGAITKIVIQ